ncbi:MAG: carbon-nitrogen hydrolase family protein [Nanoarchaeota archaeon]|nr:carbon-nitrogen hydrolase family protein [Nanoarchaeota archaeon]
MKIKIAVVQFETKQHDADHNIARAERFIAAAAKKKANLVVFPEDFILGPIPLSQELADSDFKYISIFQQFAKNYGIDIVPGSIIERDKLGMFNVVYYIDSRGEVKARYKKVNLWHPERNYLNPGNKVCVFHTRFGRIGLANCWDLAFPEFFRKMTIRGVNIVICPSWWCTKDAGRIGVRYNPTSEQVFVDACCTARAFENEIVVVYCNAAGRMEIGKYSDDLIGHSQVCVPFKGPIKKLNHNKEEMFIQELDTSLLKDAEKVYKIRADLRKRAV